MQAAGVGAIPWLISVALLLGVQPARAGNDDEVFVGNGAALVGGAVVATVRDGSTIWYNPAGLGGITRSQLDATTSVYSLRLYSAPGFMRSAQGEALDLSVSEFVTVPVQISYVRPLSSSIKLGLGYFQPRATRLVANLRFDTQAAEYPSSWTFDGISQYSEYVFGTALGFVLGPNVRFGAGALLRWDSLTESIAVFGAVRDGDATRQIIQVSQLRTRDLFGVEPTLGLQWEVTPRLTLGANLRGPRLSLLNQGNSSSSSSVASHAEDPPQIAADTHDEDVGNTSLSLLRLGRYYLGFSYSWERARLNVEGDVQPGSEDESARVQRRPTLNARLGVSYDVSKAITLGAGLFTDRAATETTEGSFVSKRSNFYGGSLGLRFSNEHYLAESESADSLVFSSTFALRYAHAVSTSDALVVDPSQDRIDQLFQMGEAPLDVHELSFYVGGGLSF